MSKLVPRLKEMVMSERDRETNDPLMWCRGDDGEVYRLQFDDGMIIHLAIALLNEAAKAAPTDPHQTAAVLSAIGFSTGFDADDNPLIRFRLENNARIGILLSPEHVSELREQLARLETSLQQRGSA
ncbi:MAG: hypothetical protein O7G83_12875 [Proteobacteria bacterium]|nr:hypothetical protein [Pseudomonadota bacterium]